MNGYTLIIYQVYIQKATKFKIKILYKRNKNVMPSIYTETFGVKLSKHIYAGILLPNKVSFGAEI